MMYYDENQQKGKYHKEVPHGIKYCTTNKTINVNKEEIGIHGFTTLCK